jgi:tetratricopeptide (TPR) repeat protein
MLFVSFPISVEEHMGLFDLAISATRSILKAVAETPAQKGPSLDAEEFAKIFKPEPNRQINWKNLDANDWIVRAEHFEALDRYDEAVDCFDVAIKFDPQETYTWEKKGELLSKIERYDEAIQCFDTILKINPRDNYAWALKGECLSKLGCDDEAIQCYDSSLKITWFDDFTLKLKGESLSKLGRYDEAIECFDTILKINPYQREVRQSRESALKALNQR